MAVTERQRHERFKWFEEQMGEERASGNVGETALAQIRETIALILDVP